MKNKKNEILNSILELSEKFYDINFNQSYFVPGISKIPVTGKVVDSEDLKSLILSCLDMWFTAGEFTNKFEKKLSEFFRIRHSIMVNSGSSANLLAISAVKELYNVQDGDEVLTAAVNFPTTLNPIIQNNLNPVLIDVDKSTYNVSFEEIVKNYTPKIKGIVLAHTLGNPFPVEEISNFCKEKGIFLVEDTCDAFGSKYNNKYVGTFGDAATLSFYPAHHITTGEGGAILTNQPKLKKIIESLRDWGRDCYCLPGEDNTCKKRFDWQLGGLPHGYDHKYIYSRIGYNLKSTEMQAALGLSQIEKIDEFIQTRKENFKYLLDSFQKFDHFELPKIQTNSDPSWFGFPLTIKNNAPFSRVQILKYLDEHNIGTRLLFGSNILLQPAYQTKLNHITNKFPVANNITENTFWIGVYPGLTIEMLDYVVSIFQNFLSQFKK